MISVVTLFIALICYFHYNQLPIYNLNLAYKFIKNSSHKENFELLSSKLGYNLNDKLLLIHADDLGLSKSVNETSIKSLLKNTVSSASVIMNAEKIQEIADFSKKNPKYWDESQLNVKPIKKKILYKEVKGCKVYGVWYK